MMNLVRNFTKDLICWGILQDDEFGKEFEKMIAHYWGVGKKEV